MCGLVGAFDRDPQARIAGSLMQDMAERIVHRGPDDGGAMTFGPAAFGHRRLSIVDLSAAGHQPMGTADARYWIVFNGEIYNFLELRAQLELDGAHFRTRTDTEVLLELYRREGERCLDHLVGMFAFAVYDRLEHTLFLARDRLGKKPLYLWENGDRLYFASELKAFYAVPEFQPTLSLSGLQHYMCTLYVPDPETIFHEVQRLPPAHCMTVTRHRKHLKQYWRPPQAWEVASSGSRSLGDAVEEFEGLLSTAVRERMVADVPLGAFLSGGIDSSLVVGEMVRHSSHRVKTTAIGFEVSDQDESPYAEAMARAFDCDHQTRHVSANTTELLEKMLYHFDEPFADSSAVPTWLLSEVTRARVTVALSGDGGDEAFGGYDKYVADERERRLRQLLPGPLVKGLASSVSRLPTERITAVRRLSNLLGAVAASPADAWYHTQSFTTRERALSLLGGEARAQLRSVDSAAPTRAAFRDAAGVDPLGVLQRVDLATYLPGDILTKVDRMSMAHALEVRCPLLDHRIMSFALKLPPELRMLGRQQKRVLKESLGRRVDRGLFERPKHGFTIPVDDWLSGPLVPLFEASVLEGSLARSGLLNVDAARQALLSHRTGQWRQGMTLWTLLVLGIWYERIRGGAVRSTVKGAPTVLTEAPPLRGARAA